MPARLAVTGKIPIASIRWIVDRMHVGTSALDVARDIWRRTRKRGKIAAWPPAMRRAAVRYALRVHAQNRALYRAVQSGRF